MFFISTLFCASRKYVSTASPWFALCIPIQLCRSCLSFKVETQQVKAHCGTSSALLIETWKGLIAFWWDELSKIQMLTNSRRQLKDGWSSRLAGRLLKSSRLWQSQGGLARKAPSMSPKRMAMSVIRGLSALASCIRKKVSPHYSSGRNKGSMVATDAYTIGGFGSRTIAS